MKILVVDDDQNSRLILEKSLKSSGYAVEIAVNGQEALEKARKSVPDMIISDILMPVMDGFKLCHEIKRDPSLKEIPFIFYTATYLDDADEKLAMSLGASRYIAKPVEPDEFIRIIKEVIGQAENKELYVPENIVEAPCEIMGMYDFSVSRKLDEKVRELEQYKNIFYYTKEAICILSTEGLIKQINPAQKIIFGHSEDELKDRPASLFLGQEAFSEIMDTLRKYGYYHHLLEAYAKNGSKLYVDASAFSALNEKAEAVSYAIIIRDITQRRMAEDEAKKARQEWERTFDAVGDIVTLLDMDMRIIRANKAARDFFETKHGDITGKLCYELFREGKEPCEGCPVPMSIKDRHTHFAEIRHENLNKTLWVSASPVYDDEGEPMGIAHFAKDITSQKKLESQLRQSQKMEAIGRLASGIAHDFNNMLNVIMGYGSLMQNELAQDNPHKHYMKEILAAADKAALLSRSLLCVSRSSVLDYKPTDINEIITGINKILSRVIGEDIELRISLKPDALPAMIDWGRIEQMLLNLSTNARDAMPEGGILSIQTNSIVIDDDFVNAHGFGQPGQYAVISVTDTGIGMDEKIQQRLFEPFFTTKEAGKGTGLGLSIVYGIVEQHKGHITCYSEPGKGTTFNIYIPMIKIALAEKEKVAYVPPPRGTETVLIAEDEESVRSLIGEVLRGSGYTVIEAANGEEAVNKYLSNKDKIDLILFDVIMPKKSGKEAYDEIFKINPQVKTIFSSGYPMDMMQKKGIISTDMNFIYKPVSPDDLLRMIRKILDESSERGTKQIK